MAGAMIWMLTAAPAATGMPPAGPARGAMLSMSWAATPAAVVVVSILLAVSCAVASIPWLARAVGPGPRVNDPVLASQAVMSAGMAAIRATAAPAGELPRTWPGAAGGGRPRSAAALPGRG
jgi:hypothetical protein